MKLAAACLFVLFAACWLADRDTAPRPGPATAVTASGHRAPAPSLPAPAASGRQWMDALPDPSTPAWQSMADARLHGDERAPPLRAPAAREPGPTAAQLADPAAYSKFEQDRDAQVMKAYAAAVESEVPRLRADVERARAAGIAPQEIAKVEAKIARLEKLRKSIIETGTVTD